MQSRRACASGVLEWGKMALDSAALDGRVGMSFARRPIVHRADCQYKLQASFVPAQM